MTTESNRQPSSKLGVEALEAREVPASFGPNRGLSIAHADVVPDPLFQEVEYITGTGPGRVALVRVWNSEGDLIQSLRPFGQSYTGGVFVAAGDVNGDFRDELIVSTAGGTVGQVRIYEFSSGGRQLLASFTPFGPLFAGPVQIATGNVTGSAVIGGDTREEIIVGQGRGGSTVSVFSFDPDASQAFQVRSFQAYEDGYTGGVSVAAANIHTTSNSFDDPYNYNFAEIITGKGAQLPQVKIFDVQLEEEDLLTSYMAFNTNFAGNRRGIDVTAGSTDGIRGAEIYVALRNSGMVRIFRGETGAVIRTFQPFPANYSRFVNFAINNTDDDVFGIHRTHSLIMVAGDGPYQQIPIVFPGRFNSPAGLNGRFPAA